MSAFNEDKAQQEKALGEGLFLGNYEEESAKIIAEAQGLEWVMVQIYSTEAVNLGE